MIMTVTQPSSTSLPPAGAHLDPRSIARALGGEVSGQQILAPGPGHSPKDRSLSIKVDPTAPDGILIHSFANDDWKVCREHIRRTLGMPEPERKKANGNGSGGEPWKFIAEHVYRDEAANPICVFRNISTKAAANNIRNFILKTARGPRASPR